MNVFSRKICKRWAPHHHNSSKYQVGRRTAAALPELAARRGRPGGELVVGGEERDPDKTVFVGNLSQQVSFQTCALATSHLFVPPASRA